MAWIVAYGVIHCGGKPEYPEKNPPVWTGDSLNPLTYRRELNPGRIGEKRLR
jgi:hypothetical protein